MNTLSSHMELRCRDAGVDCDFEIKGVNSDNELMLIAAVHAKLAHGIDPLPAEIAAKVKHSASH